jgi:hypothetical protein
MLLGVILFFDGALLALGNVRHSHFLLLRPQTRLVVSSTGTLYIRPHADHWTAKDILLLRTETENSGYGVFPGRHPPRVSEMAIRWGGRGDVRVLEFVWVSVFWGFVVGQSAHETRVLSAISSR